jgi:hypothetical protein
MSHGKRLPFRRMAKLTLNGVDLDPPESKHKITAIALDEIVDPSRPTPGRVNRFYWRLRRAIRRLTRAA